MNAFHDDKEGFIFLGIVWRYAIIKYIIWPLVARYCTVVVLTLLLSVCWCVNIRSGASTLLEPDLLGITSQMCIEGILKHRRDSLHIKCMEQYCASCRAYIVTAPAEKSITAVPWDDCKTNEISVFVLFCWALKHSDWFHCEKPSIVKCYSMKCIIFLYAHWTVTGGIYLTYLCYCIQFRPS